MWREGEGARTSDRRLSLSAFTLLPVFAMCPHFATPFFARKTKQNYSIVRSSSSRSGPSAWPAVRLFSLWILLSGLNYPIALSDEIGRTVQLGERVGNVQRFQ